MAPDPAARLRPVIRRSEETPDVSAVGVGRVPDRAHIPVPGIDPIRLAELFQSQQGGILGLFNSSRRSAKRFTIFALASCPISRPRSSCSS